jgi:hypothetical protein
MLGLDFVDEVKKVSGESIQKSLEKGKENASGSNTEVEKSPPQSRLSHHWNWETQNGTFETAP